MVGWRLAGSVSTVALPWASVLTTPTFMSAMAGRYLATGSDRNSLPSSISIMIAIDVIGLLMEASEKMASRGISTLRRGIEETDGLEIGELAFARDRHDGAGDAALLDVGFQHGSDALQPLAGEADLFRRALRKSVGQGRRAGENGGKCGGLDAREHGCLPMVAMADW